MGGERGSHGLWVAVGLGCTRSCTQSAGVEVGASVEEAGRSVASASVRRWVCPPGCCAQLSPTAQIGHPGELHAHSSVHSCASTQLLGAAAAGHMITVRWCNWPFVAVEAFVHYLQAAWAPRLEGRREVH